MNFEADGTDRSVKEETYVWSQGAKAGRRLGSSALKISLSVFLAFLNKFVKISKSL